LPQNRSTGPAAGIGLEAVAWGLVVAAQALAWSRVTSPLGGGGSHPDPMVVATILGSVAAGAGSAGWLSGRWSRLVLAAPVLGGLLGLGLAPALLAFPSFGALAAIVRLLASMVTLAPAGFCCGALIARMGARAVPGLWLGAAVAIILTGWLAGLMTPPMALAGFPLLGLLAGRWAAGPPRELRPGAALPASTRAAAAVGAFLLAMTVGAWIRYFLLLAGTTGRVRSTLLLVVVLALLLASLVAGARWWREERRPEAAALPLGLAALWALAATGMNRPLAVLFTDAVGDSASAPRGALVLSLTVLLPVTLLGALGLHRLAAAAPGARRPAAEIILPSACLALGLAAERGLVPLLGPGRLLVLCAAVLPLGLALPVMLGAAGRISPAWKWAGATALILASLAGLFLPEPGARLLSAGLGWNPSSFRFDGRPALADRLGRRRVLASVATGSGYAAWRQVSGQEPELTWQGWRLATEEPVGRGCEVVAAVLPVVLHPAPRRGLVLGGVAAGLPESMRRTEREMHVDAVPSLPGLARAIRPSRTANGAMPELLTSSTWVSGGEYDVIFLRPLAPWMAASGLAWSEEGLSRARQALAEGGLLALSLEPAAFSATAFRRVLATFLAVFPDASLWFDGQALVLLGPTEPLRLSLPVVEQRFRHADPAVRDAGLQRPVDLLARFVMPAGGLAALSDGLVPERIRRPRLVDDASRDRLIDAAGGGDALLARLAVLPADAVALFPDLQARQREALLSELTPAAEAMSHLLSARGMAGIDLQTALEHGQAAFVVRPEDRLVRTYLANLAFRASAHRARTGHLTEALGWAERAVDLDPTRVDHHLALYELLRQAGRQTAAQRRLNEMGIRFPDSYPVRLIQARRRLEQGDVNAGEALLRRAAETGFETADLPLGLAQAAFDRGQMARGREMLSRALGLGLSPALVLGDMGGRLLESQPELAMEFLRRARDLGNDGAGVIGPLGQLALREGDHQRAISLLEVAVSSQPTSARLRLDLGTGLLLAGRAGEAIPHLQEAARLAPGDPMVRLNLATALAREGRTEEAGEQVEAIGDRLRENPILLRLRHDLGMAEPEAVAPGS
jgi:tetratricopeptide (TPR) repeat protein